MALSEREQRVLADLEQQLSDEDPRLVTRMSDARPRTDVRRIVAGAVLTVVGLLTVLGGVSLHSVPLGVVGVVVMGAGLFVLTSRPGGRAQQSRRSGRGPARGTARTSGLMARLEQDWERRRGGR